MKPRYNKPTDLSGLIAKEINPPPLSDISVSRLIDDGLIILYREMKNLLALSVSGKLDPNDAKDLRDHLKLLFELKTRENESLLQLTDEQLKVRAAEVLAEDSNGDQQNSNPNRSDK